MIIHDFITIIPRIFYTKSLKICNFFEINLMVNSPKTTVFDVVTKRNFDLIPNTLYNDLYIDFNSTRGQKFTLFMNETFSIELNNVLVILMTKKIVTFDVFSHHIDNLTTKHYVLYFSHHRPHTNVTDVNYTATYCCK